MGVPAESKKGIKSGRGWVCALTIIPTQHRTHVCHHSHEHRVCLYFCCVPPVVNCVHPAQFQMCLMSSLWAADNTETQRPGQPAAAH